MYVRLFSKYAKAIVIKLDSSSRAGMTKNTNCNIALPQKYTPTKDREFILVTISVNLNSIQDPELRT